MIRKVIFSFGFALIIAICSGYYFTITKYYEMGNHKAKITKELFDQKQRNNSRFYSKEELFNIEKSVTFGVASLGLFLVISAALRVKRA